MRSGIRAVVNDFGPKVVLVDRLSFLLGVLGTHIEHEDDLPAHDPALTLRARYLDLHGYTRFDRLACRFM